MNSSIAKITPWPEANQLRGATHEDKAMKFIRDFPIGSEFTSDAFDHWAHRNGYLQVPYNAANSSGDPIYSGELSDGAWVGHLHERNNLKNQINRASTHPRIGERGVTPFKIVVVSHGGPGGGTTWGTLSAEDAIAKDDTPAAIQKLVGTRRKHLEYLMQSADWASLPSGERLVAEALYEDIESYEERVSMESRQLNKKFEKLRSRLAAALESGEVVASNGGIKQITEGDDD